MPKKLEDCVSKLMADPSFKPRKGQDKRSAAYAVCTVSLKKDVEDLTIKLKGFVKNQL